MVHTPVVLSSRPTAAPSNAPCSDNAATVAALRHTTRRDSSDELGDEEESGSSCKWERGNVVEHGHLVTPGHTHGYIWSHTWSHT